MGCPVPKVCKTGAGAALLADPDRAVALARAAGRGSGLPVTVKLRSGMRPGDRSGVEVARLGWPRRASSPGSASIRGTPPSATPAGPTTSWPRELVAGASGPGADLRRPADAGAGASRRSSAPAPPAWRWRAGSLGNPWLFSQLLGRRAGEPDRAEILAELDWVIDRAAEHLGPERAARYLRKFYPWYLERLDGDHAPGRTAAGADARSGASTLRAGLAPPSCCRPIRRTAGPMRRAAGPAAAEPRRTGDFPARWWRVLSSTAVAARLSGWIDGGWRRGSPDQMTTGWIDTLGLRHAARAFLVSCAALILLGVAVPDALAQAPRVHVARPPCCRRAPAGWARSRPATSCG